MMELQSSKFTLWYTKIGALNSLRDIMTVFIWDLGG